MYKNSNDDENLQQHNEENNSATVPTENWMVLSQWIQCICAVTFDLNLGQALEYVYPSEYVPTEQEVSNICYMAFPDSNSGCMGDTKFHMRLRSPLLNENKIIQIRYFNKYCMPSVRADESHYWGFVYFRQRRDADLPRGYFQKSLIIITRLPYFNLFYEIISTLAPKYFNEGNSVIEEACRQINKWPLLQPGELLNLKLFSYTYQILLPKATATRKLNNENKKDKDKEKDSEADMDYSIGDSDMLKNISSVNDIELFHSLSFIIDHLYTLWELILTGEPMVVVGTSPADTSYMVQTLVALIQPLDYCAEIRPYFTIHDSEFKEFTKESSKPPPSLILGVTNPFFIKLLKDWPHMLKLVDNQVNVTQQQILQKNLRHSGSVTSFSSNNSSSFKKSASLNSSSLNGSSNILTGDGFTPGLYSKYKPFLKKDKNLIKKVMHGLKTKRPSHVQTALIRRHLLELTQSFMIPLERYVASLMPLQKDISPFKSTPNANSFKLDDFLATLEQAGPQLTSPLKGDWKGLYRKFFHSCNFRGWYESRHRELQLTLQDLQLQALSAANLELWARDKQEVEIIDMILKLKQKLTIYNDGYINEMTNSFANGNGSNQTCEQIKAQIKCMKDLLPQDLKNVVNI